MSAAAPVSLRAVLDAIERVDARLSATPSMCQLHVHVPPWWKSCLKCSVVVAMSPDLNVLIDFMRKCGFVVEWTELGR